MDTATDVLSCRYSCSGHHDSCDNTSKLHFLTKWIWKHYILHSAVSIFLFVCYFDIFYTIILQAESFQKNILTPQPHQKRILTSLKSNTTKNTTLLLVLMSWSLQHLKFTTLLDLSSALRIRSSSLSVGNISNVITGAWRPEPFFQNTKDFKHTSCVPPSGNSLLWCSREYHETMMQMKTCKLRKPETDVSTLLPQRRNTNEVMILVSCHIDSKSRPESTCETDKTFWLYTQRLI